MNRSVKTLLRGSVAAAVVGTTLFAGAGVAVAATVPTFETATLNPGTRGHFTMYDAAGNPIYGGKLSDDPQAAYFVADKGGINPGDNNATIAVWKPEAGKAEYDWTLNNVVTAGDQYGSSSDSQDLPGALKGTTNAFARGLAGGTSLNDTIAAIGAPNDSNNPGIYSIHMTTGGDTSVYYDVDIQIDQAAGTWQQVFPAPPAAKTSTSVTAISANPASPAPHGTSVTLTSTVTAADGSHPAGTVELFDGTTDLGPATTFTAATGAISTTVTPGDGAHSYTFVFTPTDTTAYTGSTSPALAYTVNAQVQTETLVSAPTTATQGDSVTVHVDVNDASSHNRVVSAAGTVQFVVDGTNSGSPVALTASGADLNWTATTGNHTFSANFVPANAGYAASTGNTVTVSVAALATPPAEANVAVDAPTDGKLTISSNYTKSSPFALNPLVLSADGKSLATGNTAFSKVTITDTRIGAGAWTASASVSDFSGPGGAIIDGDNLVFSGVTPAYISGNAIQSGVNAHDLLTGFGPTKGKQPFADTKPNGTGPGSVDIQGNMSLTAPTSTQPGHYTALLTFTVI